MPRQIFFLQGEAETARDSLNAALEEESAKIPVRAKAVRRILADEN